MVRHATIVEFAVRAQDAAAEGKGGIHILHDAGKGDLPARRVGDRAEVVQPLRPDIGGEGRLVAQDRNGATVGRQPRQA